MGTTMSFVYLENQGFSRAALEEKMQALPPKYRQSNPFDALQGVLPPEFMRQFAELPADQTMLAYSQGAQWLPFYNVNLCDGNITSSQQLKSLSACFGAPVLAFALFDSDILFVSYCDAQRETALDYAKPNDEAFEEYDPDDYQPAFPEFLCAFCTAENAEKLRETWDAEEMVFADDRLALLLQLLGAPLVYDSKEPIPGYEKILLE